MRKLLLLCTLSLFCACSSRDVVEKNIEAYLSAHFSEFEIESVEYSRLYTVTLKDSKDIPSDLLTKEEITALVAGHMLGLAEGLNRKMFDWVISNDRIAQKWNIEASTYIKLGFFKLSNRDNDIFEVGIGFIVDSTYNVERALVIDDSKDYKYIYSRTFDRKQR